MWIAPLPGTSRNMRKLSVSSSDKIVSCHGVAGISGTKKGRSGWSDPFQACRPWDRTRLAAEATNVGDAVVVHGVIEISVSVVETHTILVVPEIFTGQTDSESTVV